MPLYQAQHWHTRIPTRVCLLGLFFIGMALMCMGVLLYQYQAPSWSWLLLGLLFFLSAYRFFHQPTQWRIELQADTTFGLRLANTLYPLVVTQCWINPWAVAIQFESAPQNSIAIFWRWGLSVEQWRQLHIYLLRYQLQYQYVSQKGTR